MQADNPFAKQSGFNQFKEMLQKVTLFCGTYTIIVFTILMFGVILWKGVPVLAQHGLDFVTRKTETLEVVSFDSGDKLEIPSESFETMLTYNPENGIVDNIENFQKAFAYVSFNIEKGSFISDGYLSNIEKDNDFLAQFLKRDKQASVGFTVKADCQILLTPESYQTLTQSGTSMKQLESKEIEIEQKQFEVTFGKKECEMQAKTMVALSESNFIYKLYGNLTDTADDKPNELMPLFIPKEQKIKLTPAQYSAYQADSGSAKFGDGKEIITTLKKQSFSLPKGDYIAPFNILVSIIEQNPLADILHQHNLELGVIALDLKKNSETLTLPKIDFDMMVTDNPMLKLINVAPLSVNKDFKRFSFTKACEIKLPTTDMSAFKQANLGVNDKNKQPRLNILSEHVYPYSGGGVSGPIWGTALLVITCMTIGLAIGVAAAIYLGEYSKQGGFITVIRLSMMNLAGVPSIVFGLFGLGLFVSLAPKLTSTPGIDDKVRIALLPSFSEPDLRTQERSNIQMIEEDDDLVFTLRAAQQEGQKRYYDGWVYLSFEGWGNSILSGAFTLAIMVLPIIITSSEESLRAVPKGFREASLALGATKWQSIKTAVLPYATPGILTASVLGITRVAGETAPIMFTAAVAAKSDLPINGLQGTGLNKMLEFVSQSVQAMPYHIYTVSGKLPPSDHIKPMQYGSVLVFMIIVMTFAALSVWLRIRMRKKYKW